MPRISPTWTNARARRANAIRRGDEAAATSALQDLRAARLEDHIRRLVESAPPLSETQRAKLAALLLSPETGASAA